MICAKNHSTRHGRFKPPSFESLWDSSGPGPTCRVPRLEACGQQVHPERLELTCLMCQSPPPVAAAVARSGLAGGTADRARLGSGRGAPRRQRPTAWPAALLGEARMCQRRVVQQLLGRLSSCTLRWTGLHVAHVAPAHFHPAAVPLDQATERLRRRAAGVESSENFHRQLNPGSVGRRGLLHIGRADPGSTDVAAPAALEVPLSRDPVPGDVVRRVGVVGVGDAVGPFSGVRPAQVRTRHQALVRPQLDLGL